jgi:exodeoxyribonuclease V alpha subunit
MTVRFSLSLSIESDQRFHDLSIQRDLLCTAVARARTLCVLTGSRRAMSIAIHNNKVTQRFTALEWKLRGKENAPA